MLAATMRRGRLEMRKGAGCVTDAFNSFCVDASAQIRADALLAVAVDVGAGAPVEGTEVRRAVLHVLVARAMVSDGGGDERAGDDGAEDAQRAGSAAPAGQSYTIVGSDGGSCQRQRVGGGGGERRSLEARA